MFEMSTEHVMKNSKYVKINYGKLDDFIKILNVMI